MATYFSIGEISKMFNVSTQTLRLYDRIDLLSSESVLLWLKAEKLLNFVNFICIIRCINQIN